MENTQKTNVVALGTCPACDAIVRPGSDFCYNCGGDLRDPNIPADETVEPIPPPISESVTPSENGALRNGPGISPDQKGVNRRRARVPFPRSNEPVQVVWRRDEGVGIGFIALTISAAVFAILMIAVAYYLR